MSFGMDDEIPRRDFINGTLVAAGAALMGGAVPAGAWAAGAAAARGDDWTGHGGVGDYAASNGNTWPVVSAGHRLRDGVYDSMPADVADTGEFYDCVVVGGGISGLSAALAFLRRGGPDKTCLVLDNHPIFGGEAKQNEFEWQGRRLIAHQGSALFFNQLPHSSIARFYDSIGLKTPRLAYQCWEGPAAPMELAHTPYDSVGLDRGQYGFWFGDTPEARSGRWVMDPIRRRFADAPVPADTKDQLLRWFSGEEAGAAPFSPPKVEGDGVSRALDAMTLEDHYIARFGVTREFIRRYLSPVEGGGSGLGPDALSAYCDYAADLLPADTDGDETVQMFPGGNATIARLLAKALVPGAVTGAATAEGVSLGRVDFANLDVAGAAARLRCSATVVAVNHDGDPAKSASVSVVYAVDGRLHRVRARSAIMAGGCWTTKHAVRDLPEEHRQAYGQFYRSPCLVANVAVRDWRFLYKMGLSGCRWFDGFGAYFEVRKQAVLGGVPPAISPDQPTVLSLKVLFGRPGLSTAEQGALGRADLFSTPFRDYEQRIRDQFSAMFGAHGFDARRDIIGIILNRWGHAYLSPQPGFFFGRDGQPAPRDLLRAGPFGRIAFANTDLAGVMDHRCSIIEALRAVDQLHDRVLRD